MRSDTLANVAASIASELATLAADARTLQSRLATGDVVAAVVQPSNGLTDVLTIEGLRVAAELPPSLVPGEIIAVQVTGFTGDRINLHIIPATIASAPGPRQAAPEATPLAPAPQPASQPSTEPQRGNAFGMPALAGDLGARAAVRVPATLQPLVPARARAGTPIEARIATAHAAGPAPAVLGGRTGQTPVGAPIAPRPLIAARAPASAIPLAAAPTSAAAAGREALPFTEPGTLLRALRLPVNAATVAAARIALDAPQKIPQALERVERALAGLADPRVATLRTLASFIARLEPRSPVFAAQIAAFVDHVVTGREVKLVQLLAAQRAPEPPPAASGADRNGDAGANAQTGRGPIARPLQPDPIHAERIVVRQAALDYDLKSKLFALAAETDVPQAQAPKSAELQAAVTGALTAVTALQLGAATALAANPDGIALALPIALPSGFAQARITIDRDAPGGKVALDGDNFHLAFVLETQRLGTIAIDLVTVGRTVTVGVQTEGARSQHIFANALAQLSQRLETLRYRVVKAAAVVAPPAGQAVVSPGVSRPADRARQVDVDA